MPAKKSLKITAKFKEYSNRIPAQPVVTPRQPIIEKIGGGFEKNARRELGEDIFEAFRSDKDSFPHF